MRTGGGTSEPWRVGVLFSRTGFLAVIEETQLRGTLLAIEEINEAGGVNGRPIQPVIHDPGSEESTFGQLAKRLIVEDGVTSIFGCYTSISRKAVLPVVERLNALLWYPTTYEGFEFSTNVIYTGAGPNQNSFELCRFLMQRFGPRFYLVGSNYIFPRASNRIMREFVRLNGGSVVSERYVGLRASRADFRQVVRDLRAARPDVVFSTVVGEGTVSLYQAYADAGLDPKSMPIASLTTCEAEIRAMGADVGEGHVTAPPYFEGVGGEDDRRFVARYRKAFGEDARANMCCEAAYFQVHLFARALAETNSTDTDLLRPAVLGASIDAPQGRVSVEPECGHVNLWTRIGRANRSGRFDVLHQSAGPVHADPYLLGFGWHAVPA